MVLKVDVHVMIIYELSFNISFVLKNEFWKCYLVSPWQVL